MPPWPCLNSMRPPRKNSGTSWPLDSQSCWDGCWEKVMILWPVWKALEVESEWWPEPTRCSTSGLLRLHVPAESVLWMLRCRSLAN
uniref:Uncharacterized protein n=1 Tax=Ursus americanus TaxID=9643 RepID=A0A452SGM4_URSAM